MRLVARQVPFALAAVAGLLGSTARADNAPSTAKLGEKIVNVALTDAQGKPVRLDDLKDKKAIVVVFLSFDCPVSADYAGPLAALHKTYDPRGVAFVGITVNEDEDAATVAKHAADYKIPFPVLKDAGLKAADAFRAGHTPE